MLLLAAGIREAKINEFDFVIRNHFHDVLRGGHSSFSLKIKIEQQYISENRA
jgi:hypothetical protein